MQQKFLTLANNLAKKNWGLTGQNPSVGCVIVKNNEIIATGVTGAMGSPHAEKAAIDSVKDKSTLEGVTLYVSLEPCCHYGKNPPCVDIIIKNKISRVIIAQVDYNSQVFFKGIEKLRQNGVLVEVFEPKNGVLEIYEAFFKAITTKKPFITLKMAVSKDRKISGKNGEKIQISSKKSQIFAHHLRSINDAILIGANTLKKDNPKLDCRILGLENYSPKRFILANKIDFDGNLEIFKNCEKIPTYILLNEKNDIGTLEFFGAKIILCKEKNGQIDLNFALEKIYEQGCNSVLLEGGAKTATNFLKENLIDKLILIQSQKIIGEGILAVENAADGFKKEEWFESEGDLVEIYRK